MAAWDNVGLPGSPQAPGYAAPLLDFSPLGDLAKSYYEGQGEQFKATQRKRELELQKPVTSNDPTAVISELMRRGGAPYAERLIPFLQQQQVAQPSALLGGGGPSAVPAGGATAPAPVAAPAAPAGPVAAPVAAPRPAPASAPSEVPGGNTLTGIAIGHYGADKGPQVAANAAKVFGLDPDTPLTPEQTQKVTAAFGSSSGRPVSPPVPAAGAAAAPASTAMPPAEYVLPNDPQTGQPFTDPKKAIVALRREGARLMANPYGKEQGKELLDWASNIEKSIGETRRVQGNFERTQGLAEKQFAEKVRIDEATLMQPVKIGTDSFGADVYAAKDPATGQYRRIDPKTGQVGPLVSAGEAPPSSALLPKPSGAGPSPKDLDADAKAGRNVEFLGTLDPEQQDLVRKVANNEIDPRSLSIKGGHRERILSAVAKFDPTYDQKNYASFAEGLKKFQSGKQGDAVKSFNVGIEHLDQLGELGRALDNGDIQKINQFSNWIKTNLGQAAPTNFNGLKQIVGAEIIKAIVGAGGGVSEREEAAKVLASWQSPKQTEGIIKTFQTAMGAQLGGLQRQYENSTGRKDFDRLLSPQAIRARDVHNAHGGGGASAGAGTTSPAAASSGTAIPPPPAGFELVK